MITVETDNRSGVSVDRDAAEALAVRVVTAEGVSDGELGIAWVASDEMRALKREHLGIDETTDVLSFPLDGRDELPDGGRARWATSSCAPMSSARAGAPLVHGLLHLLGYDHGEEMTARERAHASQ